MLLRNRFSSGVGVLEEHVFLNHFLSLKTSFDSGAFDNNKADRLDANVTSEEHKAISQMLAEEGFVLLKND